MADFIKKKALASVETQMETVLDNLYIMPTTKSIEIRVIDKYLDAQGKTLRTIGRKLDAVVDRQPNPEDSEDKGSIAYTDFMATAGITTDNINLAIGNFLDKQIGGLNEKD